MPESNSPRDLTYYIDLSKLDQSAGPTPERYLCRELSKISLTPHEVYILPGAQTAVSTNLSGEVMEMHVRTTRQPTTELRNPEGLEEGLVKLLYEVNATTKPPDPPPIPVTS